jgi:hypothetical protein
MFHLWGDGLRLPQSTQGDDNMTNQPLLVLKQWVEPEPPAEAPAPRSSDVGAGTVYQTFTETQDVALKVDGAGTEFIAFCRTNGSAAEVFKVTPQGVPSLLGLVTPPPNAGIYSVGLSGSGTSLVVAVTGHYFTEKPRINFIGLAAFNGVFVPNLQTTGEAAGAFTGTVAPPPPVTPPPPTTLTAADVVNALRDALGGDTYRHAAGGLVKAAAMEAIQTAFKSQGDDVVYQGVSNMVYGATMNALRSYFGKPAASDVAASDVAASDVTRDLQILQARAMALAMAGQQESKDPGITETGGTGYPASAARDTEDPEIAKQRAELAQELAQLKARFADANHADPIDEPDVPPSATVDADGDKVADAVDPFSGQKVKDQKDPGPVWTEGHSA